MKNKNPKQFYELPVYDRARRLLVQFLLSTKKTKREFKYGVCAAICNSLVDLMSYICFAYQLKEGETKEIVSKINDNIIKEHKTNIDFIKEAIDILNETKIKVRILLDIHELTQNGFEAISNLEADVSRQLENWLNSKINI
jgi:hypothetical protein